ncbi:hypothetical protein ACQE3E_12120 [Methylomonas sp. MED-D]|uniref:hypothetical protein n=1 Tax=unclassified Methylomonas TaxID=2608980 RepID=UPI0028A4E2B6|nr:hypothetical protein [Methylomonas sp. MV1]MDT4331835.1 hypothetical protein [Methylomonas sp. MV1]
MLTFCKALTIKLVCIPYLALFYCSSSIAASIYASDQAAFCERPDSIDFECGAPHVGGALANNFLGLPYESKSAIEFSLEGVTEVQSAELYLLATGYSAYPDVFSETPILEIHGYSGDGIITYDDLLQDNLILTTGGINNLGLYIFDVTNYVADLVASNQSYAGFAFKDIVMNSSVSFYTPDGMSNVLAVNGYTEYVPEVPLPSAALLFGSGMLGLLGFARKSNE